MSKRAAPALEERGDTKRQKVEEVHTARALQILLTFQQDAHELRKAIQTFKAFLDSILYPPDPEDVPRRRAILREYLENERPNKSAEKDTVYLPMLIRTWDYAGQVGNENLLSAAIAVLALVLKTISSDVDARDYGALLCRTVLQGPQLKLVFRGLSAAKHKEHIISPCLRLLTEVVSFDGGAFARQVYNRRDQTFDNRTLARLLSLRGSKEAEEKKRPSIRTNTIKYLLANFTYQNEGVKMDVIKQHNICNALFQGLHDDDPSLTKQVLYTIKTHVILDGSIPRSSKHQLLTERNLSHIASLYRVREDIPEEPVDNRKSLDIVAHEFLLLVIKDAELGVLISNCGWYPPGTDKDTPDAEEDKDEDDLKIDLGLDSIEWYNRYHDRVPVRNGVLTGLAQSLKPYSNELERELLLEIFKSAPELVADYFFKKTTFSFDPKLTLTWIGYSSFLFEAVQLPVPNYFGRVQDFSQLPPPVSIAIESILPQPLSDKVLARCLNQSTELITFFAIRIVIVAFEKLQQVLQQFSRASRTADRPALWTEAYERLVSEFKRRCPPMKDVIATFRRIPDDKIIQKEAIARLVALYYDVIPDVALSEKFDIGVPLVKALLPAEQPGTAEHEVRLLELNHLLRIAQRSPNMRWFNKPESLPFTPFVTLLKMASSAEGSSFRQMRQLLLTVNQEHDILQTETTPTALDVLIHSIREQSSGEAILGLLDNCVGRVVQRPNQYIDELDAILSDKGTDSQSATKPTSLLMVVLAEQFPFAVKASKEDKLLIQKWVAGLVGLLESIGEDEGVLRAVCDKLASTVKDQDLGKVLREALERAGPSTLPDYLPQGLQALEDSVGEVDDGSEHSNKKEIPSFELEQPPAEPQDHPALTKWMQKEVEEAIDDDIINDLVLYLCSTDPSIRLQAVPALRKFTLKLKNSAYPYKDQTWLLLNELLETVSNLPLSTDPLPYTTGAFTSHALKILSDPLHILYPKLNRFLNRGPSWTIDRLPSYWIDKVLLHPPDDDDGFHSEVAWLLDYFFDALRTPEDMEIFRKRNVFERAMAVYDSPFAGDRRAREKVLRLLWRAVRVGGATTLVTRSGIMGWVEVQVARRDEWEGSFRRLLRALYEGCDKDRVDGWSAGGVKRVVDELCQVEVN